MDALATGDIFLFEGFRLDRRGGGLYRRDERGVFVPMTIGSRALDILGLLVEQPGELVSRDAIITAVWPATVVEDNNLSTQIAALRRVLDQQRGEGSCIQTISGRGYRFVAPVTRFDPAIPSVSTPPSGDSTGAAIAETGQLRQPEAAGHLGDKRLAATSPWYNRLRAGIVGTVILSLGLVAAAAVWNWHSPWSGEVRPAPRLSIVVLPFTNLNSDPDQQYFTDAITEDLTTDLSRIAHMFVISRNTAFSYRKKPTEAKQIGHELGVRYVLEGSVQRSGNQVRINAQLIDAETSAHIWAERFDRDTGDLFALQNEITRRIALALDAQLIAAEAARPTEHPDALDYILRARAAWSEPKSRENYAEAISLFERALAVDPGSVEAQTRLVSALTGRVLDEMADSAAADIARAEGLIGQALASSPRSPLAHWAKGQLLRATGRCEEAIREYETALASNRNWASAIAHIGRCKIYIGPIEEAIPLEEQAIRLSPRDPDIGVWYFRIGQVHLLQSRIDEATAWLQKARSASPKLTFVHRWLASAYALKGETERAAAELAEARRLSGNGSPSSIPQAKASAARDFAAPAIRAMVETTYLVGLRKAGVPKE
jgi:TolB-like protein/DNA-binding winged helix-turn-helix (wHTH) protein/Flp pilus assembly protein TadD